jgi:hypothetical protein
MKKKEALIATLGLTVATTAVYARATLMLWKACVTQNVYTLRTLWGSECPGTLTTINSESPPIAKENLKETTTQIDTGFLDDELVPLPDNPRLRDFQYCLCGLRGVYLLDRWYCQECYENGDDEKDDDWIAIGGGWFEDSKGNRWQE